VASIWLLRGKAGAAMSGNSDTAAQRRFVPCRGDFLSENQLFDGLVAVLLSAPPAIWFKARRKVIGFPRKRRKSDSQENGELN
jgi:hypothetical protein